MTGRLRAFLLVCLALLSSASCQCTSDTCTADFECGGGKFCSSGHCFVAAGAVCFSASNCACPTGQFVAAGQCTTPAPSNTQGVCNSRTDCSRNGGKWACTPAHSCIRICTANSDCDFGQTCEDLVCRTGGVCDPDSDCGSGVCVGGQCAPAPIPIVCTVIPRTATAIAGSTTSFSVVARDSSGAPVRVTSDATWSVDGVEATIEDRTPTVVAAVAAGASESSGFVSASLNGEPCDRADLTVYAAPDPLKLRVVVVSELDGTPVPDATVVLDDQLASTGTDGVARFDAIPGDKHTVSAFAHDFAYLTVVETVATDILLPLHPKPNPARFEGQLKDTDFNNISNPQGTLHVWFGGGSIAGNLVDLSVETLLKPTQSMTISLGTGTPFGPFDVPNGFALGLGAQMFGQPTQVGGHVGLAVTPGTRALWALGGNAIIGDILKAVGPVLNAGGSGIRDQFPNIAAALVPVVGGLESAVTSGILAIPGQSKTVSVGGAQPSLKLDALSRFRLDVTTPELPTYHDDAGQPARLDGLLIVGGALVPHQGFVPLGLTMGVDGTSPETADGFTDPLWHGQAQHLPLRLAPQHGGIEGSPWAYITLAAPLTKLVQGDESVVFSGHLTVSSGPLSWNNGQPSSFDLSRPLLAVAEGASIDDRWRTATVPSVAGATYEKLDLGGESGWSIYFPPGTTSIPIPEPPAGFEDRFAGSAVVKAVSLRTGSTTWDGIWQFDSVNANDLAREVDAFSVRSVPRVSTSSP